MSADSRKEFSQNIQHFHDAALLLKWNGYRVVNPANVLACRFKWIYSLLERFLGKEVAYRLVLCYDLWLLSNCDQICLIDDWHNSRGAKIEENFSFRLGIFHSHDYHPLEKKLTSVDERKAKINTPVAKATESVIDLGNAMFSLNRSKKKK